MQDCAMNEVNYAIAKAISELRLSAALSQEELADAADIHRTYVSQIERGLKSPTIHVLLRIAAALKVKPSDIMLAIERELHEVPNKS